MLPAKLEAPVRIGYLLCRIADTIEDDLALAPERKAELLDELLACFDDPRRADEYGLCVAELSANDDYLELVATTGQVFFTYRLLDAPTRAILRRWIAEMVARDEALRARAPLRHPHQERRRVPRVLLLRRGHGRASAHRAVARALRRRRQGDVHAAAR